MCFGLCSVFFPPKTVVSVGYDTTHVRLIAVTLYFRSYAILSTMPTAEVETAAVCTPLTPASIAHQQQRQQRSTGSTAVVFVVLCKNSEACFYSQCVGVKINPKHTVLFLRCTTYVPVPDARYLILGTWYVIPGTRYLVL